MSYSVDKIVEDVRVALDENTSVSAFTDDAGTVVQPDTLEMEEIIRSKIADGLDAVRMAAPLRHLDFVSSSPSVEWTDEAKGIGRVKLPGKFLRLSMFKMSDWAYGVSEAITPSDDIYKQQWSDYKGVRGNANNPVVAIAGNGKLEFFSCDSTSATATLLYIARVTGVSDSYDIEGDIYRAVVLKTAALVMAAYGSSEMMQLLNALSEEQIGK